MFSAIIPTGGYTGWTFLQKTGSRQQALLNKSPEITRDIDYFKARIGKVRTADDLVNDRRLLSVALTAYGLEVDINNKAFLRKVLADGTEKDSALANRLADKRYLEFSKAFGFGDGATPNTQVPSFVDKIVSAFQAHKWETAVGQTDNNMRLALNAQRELARIAESRSTDDTKWLTVLGSPPLRSVFQGALGLPPSFASVDLDTQMTTMRKRSRQVFGGAELDQFKDPVQTEKLVRLFLVRSSASATQTSSAAMALGIFQARLG